MADNTTGTMIVAQAEGEAGHETVVVEGAEHDAAAETHAETGADEHATVFPPFDASTFASQLLWLAITFGALYLVLSRFAMPQIGSILEARKAKIEGDLAEAEKLRLETEKALADYEDALATARKNAHGIAEETRAAIKADLDAKRTAVEADLSKKVATAEGRIQTMKTAALANVDEIAGATAAAVVAQLGGDVSEADARAAVASLVKG
jgi:F-type H+-transporting ATPase subunit b